VPKTGASKKMILARNNKKITNGPKNFQHIFQNKFGFTWNMSSMLS
jgi:hypothetical protein